VYPTFTAHGYSGRALSALSFCMCPPRFYHQFVRKDGLFERVFFGRRVSTSSTSAE
jgi:hypothetical protein